MRDEPPAPPPPTTAADPSTGGCEPAHLRLGASQLEICCEGSVLWSAWAWYRLETFRPSFAVTGLEPLDLVPFAAELDIPAVGVRNPPTLVPVVRTPQHQNGREGQQQVMWVDLQFHHEHGRPTEKVQNSLSQIIYANSNHFVSAPSIWAPSAPF